MHILHDFSLKDYNTFRIDARCNHFVELNTEDGILTFIELNQGNFPKHLILGGGSNLLFTKDFDGHVLKISNKGIQVYQQDHDSVLVGAMAGEVWDDFVQFAVNQGYGGLENLSLIPGTVGASPIQNIGAYGVELCDVFHSCRAVQISDGTIHTFTSENCRFGYRDSFFKQEGKGRFIILEVIFRLSLNPVLKLDYGAIRTEIQKSEIRDEEINISDIRNAVCSIRRSKLPDPEQIGNAGSFFKNPVIDTDLYQKLLAEYPDIVAFPQTDGRYKLAAAWLIDRCGWKGFRENDAGVHVNQALVLVNYGLANGHEILQLSNKIIDSVFQKFNVRIEKEVNIV